MSNHAVLAGLDLSLTASGVAIASTNWDGVWTRVSTLTVGFDLVRGSTDRERAIRCAGIAEKVIGMLRYNKVSKVYLESYAFSGSTQAHSLGELGGVVKHRLLTEGYQFSTANMSTARKLLLGKVPRSGVKMQVKATLEAAGAPRSWTDDERDAFVCLNWGLSDHAGAFCLAQEPAR
jgi:hypothetical protein